MATNLPERRSTLRQKGWYPSSEVLGSPVQCPKSPLDLQKPLPPRPVSLSSSVYSDDKSSCKSVEAPNVDLMSRQNPNRYGMDVSRILPPAHPEYCCDIDEEGEEDSLESSSPATPVGPPEPGPSFRSPVYSMHSTSGSYAYNFSPWSPRKNDDFPESISNCLQDKESPRTNKFTLMDQGRRRASSKTKDLTCSEDKPKGLGINHLSVGPPVITFAGPAMHHTYSNLTKPRRAPAPPPLKLYERALADSYVKTPYPSAARHMSIMSQKSVFDDNDDDDDEFNPYSGRRRKESLYLKRFSGLGDFTQSLRRSSIRMSMSADVQEIIPTIDTSKHRAPPRVPSVMPLSAGRVTVHEQASPSTQPRRTTSAPAPAPERSKVKSMLLKAKRSLSLGFAEDSKKEKKDSKEREALRKMVQSGTTEAKLGQNLM